MGILSSLSGFGFRQVFGVNAHGDIEHSLAIMEAFKEASIELEMKACYAFDESRLVHFGLTGTEPYICLVKPQTISVSTVSIPDVHAGDIETATMYYNDPCLVDVEKARSLHPVPLTDQRAMDWLFGGHINELSEQGYLGSPAEFEGVLVRENIDDYATRITQAILERL